MGLRSSAVVLLLLLAGSRTWADETRNRAWEGVKEWRGTVTIKADDTSSGSGVTIKTNSGLRGTFGPLVIAPDFSSPGSPVWVGSKVTGTQSINTTQSSSLADTSWIGSGNIPAGSEVKLSIDLDKNTYELHLFIAEINGTYTVDTKGPVSHSSQPDTMAVGGFTRTFPLPGGGPTKIEEQFKCTFAECPVHGAGGAQPGKLAVEVELELEPNTKLKAVPGGPYTVERGQVVNLDGRRSEGGITRHTWKVTPGRCPGAAAPSAKEHDGATWSFTALCPATATLTVTDGHKSDSKAVAIAVDRRASFVTQFSDAATEKPLDLAAPFYPPPADGVVGGENKCAYDPEPPHTLHPADSGGTWEGVGYTLKQVSDDGPFDTYWYVDSESLEVARQIGINKYLLPGGPRPFTDIPSIYDRNKAIEAANGTGMKKGANIDGYLAAVRAHERLHSKKMKEAIGRRDPARKIEPMIERGRDALKHKVDAEIKQSELAICNAAKDPIAGERTKRFPLEYPQRSNQDWYRVAVTVGGSAETQKICE